MVLDMWCGKFIYLSQSECTLHCLFRVDYFMLSHRSSSSDKKKREEEVIYIYYIYIYTTCWTSVLGTNDWLNCSYWVRCMMLYSCNTNNSFWFSMIYFAEFLLKSQLIRLSLKKVVQKNVVILVKIKRWNVGMISDVKKNEIKATLSLSLSVSLSLHFAL